MLLKINSEGYTVVSSETLKNPNLSLKAKGVLCLILSLKDVPELTEKDLVLFAKDGITGIRSSLKELEDCGYLKRERIRDENGKLQGAKWIVIDNPEQ